MIVSDNANLYGSLFEKANAALNFTSDADKITNIDEYFTCIKRLAEYEKENNTDPIFTILPINEDTFDIEANTRKIDIPSSFMTAGIGVKGDEVAEVLYFTIDRYFDIADLYHKDILIQWTNADGDKGLSLTINKSLSYKPGKVTFGWPISSEITKAAGNVQFSVRFYDRFEDDKSSYLTYSFSTLTASVKVNPALDFEISDEDAIKELIVDRTQRIYDNLKDSEPTGFVNPAAEPVFETNFNLPDEMNLNDLTQTVTINNQKKKAFLVKAHITNETFGAVGNIKYSWEHKDKNGTLLATPEFGDYYIKTTDSTRQENDTYYIKKDDGKYEIFLNSFEPGGIYYEKYSYCIPSTAGVYKVTATNVAGRVSTASVEDSCLVPYAKEVNYSIDDSSIILVKQVIDDIEQNTYEAQDIRYTITPQDEGDLSYQWKYSPNYAYSEASNEELLSGATDLIGETKEEISIDRLGRYWLMVTNTCNNDSIICAPKKAIRVTEAATTPTITKFSINGELKALAATIQTSIGKEISYILGNTVNTDTIYTYQWMRQIENGWEDIPGATTEKCTPSNAGGYACRITNHYNESTADLETVNNIFIIL